MASLIMRQDWIYYRIGDRVRFNQVYWELLKDNPDKPESGKVYIVQQIREIPRKHQPTHKHNQFLLLEGYNPPWHDSKHPPWTSGALVELVNDTQH
jgi:hypothetical protein